MVIETINCKDCKFLYKWTTLSIGHDEIYCCNALLREDNYVGSVNYSMKDLLKVAETNCPLRNEEIVIRLKV